MFNLNEKKTFSVTWGPSEANSTGLLQPVYTLEPTSEVESQEDILTVLEEFTQFMQTMAINSEIDPAILADLAYQHNIAANPNSSPEDRDFAIEVIQGTFNPGYTREGAIISWQYNPYHKYYTMMRLMTHDATVEHLQKEVNTSGADVVAAKYNVPVAKIEELVMRTQHLTEHEQTLIVQALIRYINSPAEQELTNLPDLSRFVIEFSETNLPPFQEGYPLDQLLLDELIFRYNIANIPQDSLPEMPEASIPAYQEGFDPSFIPENQPGFHIPENIGSVTPAVITILIAALIAMAKWKPKRRFQ